MLVKLGQLILVPGSPEQEYKNFNRAVKEHVRSWQALIPFSGIGMKILDATVFDPSIRNTIRLVFPLTKNAPGGKPKKKARYTL